MPSKHTSATTTSDRRTYPGYRADLGEDPARFLAFENPHPRIRGLNSPALVAAYLDVETDREQPRKPVVAHLNRRKAELEGST